MSRWPMVCSKRDIVHRLSRWKVCTRGQRLHSVSGWKIVASKLNISRNMRGLSGRAIFATGHNVCQLRMRFGQLMRRVFDGRKV